MQRSRLIRWGLTVLTLVSLAVLTTPAFAELKPGDKLDKSNCQDAKGLLPDVVLEQFCAGQFTADIVEVKDEQFQYSKKFKAGSEANAGKYYVTDNGYMYADLFAPDGTFGTTKGREALAAVARNKSAVVRGLVPTDATGRDRTRRHDAGLTGR